MLTALRDRLLNQELFNEFCDEFTREMNRLRMEYRASLTAAERELERVVADNVAPGDDDDGSEWALMLLVAEDVSWDDAEGSSPYVRPAAVDRALIELTAEERDRLLQLILTHVDRGARATKVYDRYVYNRAKRAGLETWAKRLREILQPKT